MIRDPESGRVLLVDDDLLVRTMASATLRQAGFAVTEADSGEQALRLFDDKRFDLVLLDVMMPGMDGYAVCERLRCHANGTWLPILMLTGLNDTESIQMAYRSGATDFITKPINWTLLVHRVRYGLRASLATESVMRSRESLARAQRLANLGNWEWWPAQGRIVCSDELLRILGPDEHAALPCHAGGLPKPCPPTGTRCRAGGARSH